MYEPKPEDKFTFGLWTIANRGRDPFGDVVRETPSPVEIAQGLAKIGAWGVSFHDNDLIPIDATPSQRDSIVREFKKALDENGLKVGMATINMFTDPVFKDGGFTANDGHVRAYALQKAMQAIDTGAELGADVFVFWGGREGSEVDFSKDPAGSMKRYREALDFLCGYVKDQGYQMRLSLEAKPNEPRGDICLSTTGACLGLIATLAHPEMVGVNPEVAHEMMANLNVSQVLGQCLDAGKLFLVHLNSQKFCRYDQDLRFASEDLHGSFSIVHTLETHGYTGCREFDAHAYRTEDMDGVWDFAKGCMRSYLILKEKALQLEADPEVQEIRRANDVEDAQWNAAAAGYSPAAAGALKSQVYDRCALAARGLRYERLGQIATEILLGVR